jgi:hypothetical protein
MAPVLAKSLVAAMLERPVGTHIFIAFSARHTDFNALIMLRPMPRRRVGFCDAYLVDEHHPLIAIGSVEQVHHNIPNRLRVVHRDDEHVLRLGEERIKYVSVGVG